jgi:hypothetical protein
MMWIIGLLLATMPSKDCSGSERVRDIHNVPKRMQCPELSLIDTKSLVQKDLGMEEANIFGQGTP